MATPFTQGLCEKVQSSVLEILGSNKAPELKRTKTGYLSALRSPENLAGVNIVPIDEGNGKKKTVRVTYLQRGCEDDIVTTENTSCSPDVFRSPLEKDINITKYIATKWMAFNVSDMRKLCGPDDLYRASVMNSEVDALMRKLDKELLTIQAANFGEFSPYSQPVPAYQNYKEVKLLNSCASGINYSGEATIMEDFNLLDTQARPIIIGAGNISKYAQMAKIGCCNDLGIDTSKAGAFDFYHDRYVEEIIGAGKFIGLVPGYVQLLTWNKNVGDYAISDAKFEDGTYTDPFTGIKLDMEWKYDDCLKQYIVRFSLNYELHFIPTDSFQTCDELNGVNFTLAYKAVNADC